MVALAVSLVWLLAWSIGTGSTARSSWARRLIIATLCGATILVYTIGTADLVRRWSDIENTNSAGSGRLLLWRVSVEEFLTATATEQLFGRGVQGMVDMMYNSVGAPLSSHNDVMEMLVIGGVAGVFVVGLILAGLIIQIRPARLASPEFATAVAILLTCCCQMFFTGQLGLPDVMTFYLLGITAVLACARSRPSAAVMPTAMAVRTRVRGVSRVGDTMRHGDRAGRYDLLKN
jgi:hypothetical protein